MNLCMIFESILETCHYIVSPIKLLQLLPNLRGHFPGTSMDTIYIFVLLG